MRLSLKHYFLVIYILLLQVLMNFESSRHRTGDKHVRFSDNVNLHNARIHMDNSSTIDFCMIHGHAPGIQKPNASKNDATQKSDKEIESSDEEVEGSESVGKAVDDDESANSFDSDNFPGLLQDPDVIQSIGRSLNMNLGFPLS